MRCRAAFVLVMALSPLLAIGSRHLQSFGGADNR